MITTITTNNGTCPAGNYILLLTQCCVGEIISANVFVGALCSKPLLFKSILLALAVSIEEYY